MGLAWVRPGSSSRIGYRSSAENGSLRGLLAEVRTGRLTWTAICSGTAWDAVADTAGRFGYLPSEGDEVFSVTGERPFDLTAA